MQGSRQHLGQVRRRQRGGEPRRRLCPGGRHHREEAGHRDRRHRQLPGRCPVPAQPHLLLLQVSCRSFQGLPDRVSQALFSRLQDGWTPVPMAKGSTSRTIRRRGGQPPQGQDGRRGVDRLQSVLLLQRHQLHVLRHRLPGGSLETSTELEHVQRLDDPVLSTHPLQADPDSSLARLMERLERMESTSDEDLTERASEGTAGRPLKALLPEGAVQTSLSRPVQQRQRPPARQRHHSCNVPIGGHWSGSPAGPGTAVQGRHPHRVALGILPSSIGIGPGGFFVDDYDRFFSSAAQLQQLQRRQPPIGSGHCGRWRHQSMSSICQQVPSTASVVSKASQPPQRRHSSGGCGSRWWHRPLGLNPGPETDARPPLLQQKPPADPAGAVGPRGRPMAENGAKDGAHNDSSGAYSPDNDETDAIKEFSSF